MSKLDNAPPPRPIGAVLAVVTAVCVALALWLFPKAQPTIALKQELTRESAIERARTFATAHALPIANAEVAVRFSQDGEAQTFIELEAGGKDTVNVEVNRRDVALFTWTVRFFRHGDPREVRVTLSPDGHVIGFRNTLAQADTRAALDSAGAYAYADSLRIAWLGLSATAWKPVATSVETVQPSKRLDRTITWERTDRTLGAAPLRLDVVVRGDLAGGARQYVKIPEPFRRRYAERRADNDLYALIASLFVPIFALFGIAALVGARKRGLIRWRPALIVGSVMGLVMALAQLNEIPGSYFQYDTALPPGTFLAQQWLAALVIGIGMCVVSTILLATGELLTREAFPEQFDWWQTARHAGTRPIALRLLGGYTLAAFGLAYVSIFYLTVERGLGWWSPSSLLDDPNQIASPFPWLSAVATSLQAGVLEEVLFRAIPLALIARAVANKSWRMQALTAGVVLTALVFGFAHANYPSFPAYARGVELFAEAVLWAVLYLRVGLVPTVVGHFTYDLTLFGLFAAAGDAPAYRVTLAVVIVVAAIPALLVARKAWRTRGLVTAAPDSARFSAWQPMPMLVTAEMPIATAAPITGPGWIAALAAVAALVAGLWPTAQPAPPRFTATRAQAVATADSVLRTLDAIPTEWTRLVDASSESWPTERRFLAQHDSTKQLASRVSRNWLHGGSWDVRYVHTTGTVAERTESWNVVLGADGRPHTWSHVLADSAPAPTISRDSAERAARAALIAAGASPTALVLLSATETARPARHDVEFDFTDTSILLPANASLRRSATVSGDKVTRLGHLLFLPETWKREDAARSSTRSIMAAGPVLALVLLGIVGLVRFMRRPPHLAAMKWPSRRTMITLVSLVGVSMAVLSANDWPAMMHGWDTASPFNRHQWTSMLTLLGGTLGAAAAWGMWLATDAARRRMGVPVRAVSARDAWLVGAALALGPRLPDVIPALLLPHTPSPVGTVLDQFIPIIGRLTDAISSALFQAPLFVLIAGALLVIKVPVARVAALIVAAGALGLVSASAGALLTSTWLAHAAVHATSMLLMALVFWKFGRSSMEAWFIGALVSGTLSQVGSGLVAASMTDHLSHMLAAACAIVVGVVLTRRPRSATTQTAPARS
ncbi:MAG: CPBP family intramembrane metalloprotease [Gemmatimonadaceae bacterium]|nr:CPBP family intramembrane metalloprotease [Gemmatimonadaceae bacterium]